MIPLTLCTLDCPARAIASSEISPAIQCLAIRSIRPFPRLAKGIAVGPEETHDINHFSRSYGRHGQGLELANSKSNARSRVRIVALGDSLTVGFGSDGGLFYEQEANPYTDVLIGCIRLDFATSALSVEVVNKGVNGDLTEQMVSRFDSDVLHLSPRIVIILGGSNDLGWGLTPTEVFSNLLQMYTLSLKNAITPIACTVPSILGYDAGIPPRLELNELIRRHCQRTELRIVDLFSATVDHESRRLDPRYSSDGLHLSAEGYGKMGEAVYEEALRPLLSEIAEQNLR